MLQVRFGESDVARTAHIRDTHHLRKRTFYSCRLVSIVGYFRSVSLLVIQTHHDMNEKIFIGSRAVLGYGAIPLHSPNHQKGDRTTSQVIYQIIHLETKLDSSLLGYAALSNPISNKKDGVPRFPKNVGITALSLLFRKPASHASNGSGSQPVIFRFIPNLCICEISD